METTTATGRTGKTLTMVVLDADGKFLTLFNAESLLTAYPVLHRAAEEDAAAGRSRLTSLADALPAADWTLNKIMNDLEPWRDRSADAAVLALGEATTSNREDFPDWGPWDATELVHWLDANPAWTSGCGRPHPFGGYHEVSQEQAWHERYTFYWDADGKLHRTDGPAAITINGRDRLRTESWHHHGKNLTPGHVSAHDDDRWPEGFQPWQASRTVALDHDEVEVGAVFTDYDGELHRDGGPAKFTHTGERQWWWRGQMMLFQPGSAMVGTQPDCGPFLVTTEGDLVPGPADTLI